MSSIRKELVERHVQMLTFIPGEWEVAARPGYKLDFRMCQIQKLQYAFNWGDGSYPLPDKATITHTPGRLLVLDLSLNELTEVTAENLAMMSQLRVLDVSLNRLTRFDGVECCKWLYHLNLSHNQLTGGLQALSSCRLLTELDLSMNQLSSLSAIPSLSNLSTLRVNNNRLFSLDGVQGLAGLKDLSCQRNNIRDLMPLSSSLRLINLNASDNQLISLDTTVDVLKGLKRLQNVILFGNPIEQEYNYHEYIMKATNIQGLDNVNIRPKTKYIPESSEHFTIKDAAKQAFLEKLQDKRLRMQENVQFLQQKIDTIQDEYREYEESIHRDMDACMLYLDSLGPDQLQNYDVLHLRSHLSSPAPKPWEQAPFIRLPDQNNRPSPRDRAPSKQKKTNDYKDLREVPEILRRACNELVAAYPVAEKQTPSPSQSPSQHPMSPNTPTW